MNRKKLSFFKVQLSQNISFQNFLLFHNSKVGKNSYIILANESIIQTFYNFLCWREWIIQNSSKNMIYFIAFPDIIKQNSIHCPTYISYWMVHWLKWFSFDSFIPFIIIYLSQDLPFSPCFPYIRIINEVIHNMPVAIMDLNIFLSSEEYLMWNLAFAIR